MILLGIDIGTVELHLSQIVFNIARSVNNILQSKYIKCAEKSNHYYNCTVIIE
jgi:hypothetical protein